MVKKRPTWATIVGVMGIIVGCLGILGGVQSITMPGMIDMQKALWTDMKASMEQHEITEPHRMPSEEIFRMMENMWDIPDWFSAFCLLSGIITLFVSGFYAFAAIRILQTHPAAIKLFYAAAAVSIGFTIMKAVFVMVALSFMGMSMIVGGLLGVVINVVLLFVVATSDKTVFAPQQG